MIDYAREIAKLDSEHARLGALIEMCDHILVAIFWAMLVLALARVVIAALRRPN